MKKNPSIIETFGDGLSLRGEDKKQIQRGSRAQLLHGRASEGRGGNKTCEFLERISEPTGRLELPTGVTRAAETLERRRAARACVGRPGQPNAPRSCRRRLGRFARSARTRPCQSVRSLPTACGGFRLCGYRLR